jgi:hypothetical protein
LPVIHADEASYFSGTLVVIEAERTVKHAPLELEKSNKQRRATATHAVSNGAASPPNAAADEHRRGEVFLATAPALSNPWPARDPARSPIEIAPPWQLQRLGLTSSFSMQWSACRQRPL